MNAKQLLGPSRRAASLKHVASKIASSRRWPLSVKRCRNRRCAPKVCLGVLTAVSVALLVSCCIIVSRSMRAARGLNPAGAGVAPLRVGGTDFMAPVGSALRKDQSYPLEDNQKINVFRQVNGTPFSNSVLRGSDSGEKLTGCKLKIIQTFQNLTVGAFFAMGVGLISGCLTVLCKNYDEVAVYRIYGASAGLAVAAILMSAGLLIFPTNRKPCIQCLEYCCCARPCCGSHCR
eukprot:GHVT01019879.1.p1 GENE.GHVT01019879.1~~GHVT01019879.1.p1  ORF type:complete len:233 (+),score=0.96 GHVT01019879.1:668-1366(+)